MKRQLGLVLVGVLGVACGGDDEGGSSAGTVADATGSEGTGADSGSATSTTAGSASGSGSASTMVGGRCSEDADCGDPCCYCSEGMCACSAEPRPDGLGWRCSHPEFSCDGLQQELCDEYTQCESVMGQPLMPGTEFEQWCLGEETYLGCIATGTSCNDGPTIVCDARTTAFQTQGCVPAGYSECSVSGEVSGSC